MELLRDICYGVLTFNERDRKYLNGNLNIAAAISNFW